ncbi:nucleotide pyrophosphohydrolase [Candidatus Nitrospira bockiana]
MDELAAIMQEIRHFVAERDWQQFHDPKNLAMAIASEAGELLAEYRWVATAAADDLTRDEGRRRRVSAEVADVAIALLLFCDRTGIDLSEAIRTKMAVNRRNYPIEQSRGRADRPDGSRQSPAKPRSEPMP